ncbi:MAG: GNAT family N-acetyltransferase [Proteobacteria bacterium]|nr:GNAT family N-acetyltransferase [Pseudomonadota bacterium]
MQNTIYRIKNPVEYLFNFKNIARRTDPLNAGGDYHEWASKLNEDYLSNSKVQSFGAFNFDKSWIELVGFVNAHIEYDDGAWGVVPAIYILPGFKKEGLGRGLLTVAEQALVSDRTDLRLSFKIEEWSKGFYKKLGYEIIHDEETSWANKIVTPAFGWQDIPSIEEFKQTFDRDAHTKKVAAIAKVRRLIEKMDDSDGMSERAQGKFLKQCQNEIDELMRIYHFTYRDV